jgi:hypothetical protein
MIGVFYAIVHTLVWDLTPLARKHLPIEVADNLIILRYSSFHCILSLHYVGTGEVHIQCLIPKNAYRNLTSYAFRICRAVLILRKIMLLERSQYLRVY